MAVKTANMFGEITITDEAIAMVAAKTALDCYGVVSLATKKLTDSFSELFSRHTLSGGIKVITLDNHIQIDLFIILKYGVSLPAVCESLKKSIKYSVEAFTGMIVDNVNVNVMGVRV